MKVENGSKEPIMLCLVINKNIKNNDRKYTLMACRQRNLL